MQTSVNTETIRKLEWRKMGQEWAEVPLGTFGPQNIIEEFLDDLTPPERDMAEVTIGSVSYRLRVVLICTCCRREFL